MKKCFLIFLLLLCCIPALAHGGRTDSRGGHYDHATGTYHYHHGHPAHQHPDGVCPYDFDDRTGASSGVSDGSGSSRPSPTPSPVQEPADTPRVAAETVLFYSALAVGGGGLYVRSFLTRRREARAKYSGRSISELAGVPAGYQMGFDGTVTFHGQKVPPRDLLVVYVSRTGKYYHASGCSWLKSRREMPLSEARLAGLRPCKRCSPSGQLPQWLKTYRHINAQRKKFHIDMRP